MPEEESLSAAVSMVALGLSIAGRVSGPCFECAVEQRYRNDGNRNLEVVYTFPLPVDAVLLDVELRLGDRVMRGVVMARPSAQRRYEDAVEQGDLPVMIERSPSGLYTANVGNLMPGEAVTVRYRWAILLRFEHGALRVSIPTVVPPRYGRAHEDGGLSLHESVQASIGVDHSLDVTIRVEGTAASGRVESPTHPITCKRTEAGVTARLAAGAFADRDFVLQIHDVEAPALVSLGVDGEAHVAVVAFHPDDDALRLPGAATGVGAGLVKILVDCSGSMAGDSIACAARGLKALSRAMDPGRPFTFSRFGSSVIHEISAAGGSTREQLEQLTQRLDHLRADLGGTEMKGALEGVMNLGARGRDADLLLITDGAVWAVESTIALARRSGHRIFAIGVGSAPAESLLRKLADETGGACELVTPNEDIAAAVQRMAQRMESPRFTSCDVAWPDAPLWSTPLLRAAFAGDTLHALAGFARRPVGTASLVVRGNHGPRHAIATCEIPATLPAIADLARLAAHERLATATPEAALELALRYQLVTGQTCLVAVHERADGARPTGLPDLHHMPHMLAAGWGGVGSVERVDACRMKMCLADSASDHDSPYSLARREFAESLPLLDELQHHPAPGSIPAAPSPMVAGPRSRFDAPERYGSPSRTSAARPSVAPPKEPVPSDLVAVLNDRIGTVAHVHWLADHPESIPLPASVRALLADFEGAVSGKEVALAFLAVVAEWPDVTRHARRAIRAAFAQDGALGPLQARIAKALEGTTPDTWKVRRETVSALPRGA